MAYDNHGSRSDRYEKRRKNTKIINALIILVVILSAFLIGLIVFGDDDEQKPTNGQNNEAQENNHEEDEGEKEDDHQQQNESTEDENTSGNSSESKNEDDTDQESVTENEPSDDEQVKEVLTKDWEPYPTEQEEPHTIKLSEGTQDRFEIEMALSKAVEVPQDQLIYWWLESGGVPDRIIGYVEDKSNHNYYRVILKWMTNEGWEPQRVDVLYENLGKEKFNDQTNNND